MPPVSNPPETTFDAPATKTWVAWIRNKFLAGLALAAPLIVTFWILQFVYGLLHGWAEGLLGYVAQMTEEIAGKPVINLEDPMVKRITAFAGEDLDPAWLPDGQSYAWLSEQGGTLNIWQTRLDGGTPVQLTHYTGYPVRSLSVAGTGRMCYTQDGALWTLDPGGEPRRLKVQVPLAPRSGDAVTELHGEDARGAVLSPDGAWIAFTVRGDLFVTSTAHGTTRRLTETAWQERDR